MEADRVPPVGKCSRKKVVQFSKVAATFPNGLPMNVPQVLHPTIACAEKKGEKEGTG